MLQPKFQKVYHKNNNQQARLRCSTDDFNRCFLRDFQGGSFLIPQIRDIGWEFYEFHLDSLRKRRKQPHDFDIAGASSHTFGESANGFLEKSLGRSLDFFSRYISIPTTRNNEFTTYKTKQKDQQKTSCQK